MSVTLSDSLREKMNRRAVEEAVANFLLERDESTLEDERDDDERKASASCIVTLVAKVAAHQNKETAMSEMIKRVTKAIHESLGYETPWETCTQCESAARAAIEAMREPPETMWGAAIGDGGWGDCEASEFVWRWNLAIDAALQD